VNLLTHTHVGEISDFPLNASHLNAKCLNPHPHLPLLCFSSYSSEEIRESSYVCVCVSSVTNIYLIFFLLLPKQPTFSQSKIQKMLKNFLTFFVIYLFFFSHFTHFSLFLFFSFFFSSHTRANKKQMTIKRKRELREVKPVSC
jgi:hypothetical protein